MAKVNPRHSNGHRARRLATRLRAEGRGCWICREFGRPDAIDYSLPPGDPGAFEVDHLVPVSRGGDLYAYDNADAAHRACNAWRKGKSVGEVRALARAARSGREGPSPAPAPTTEW